MTEVQWNFTPINKNDWKEKGEGEQIGRLGVIHVYMRLYRNHGIQKGGAAYNRMLHLISRQRNQLIGGKNGI